MTAPLFVALAVAGGFGAACRFLLDGLITSRATDRPDAVPRGTLTVNTTGSLALGLVTALTAGHVLPDAVHAVVGAGFLGGYTTFSTASHETVRLLLAGRRGAGLLHGLGGLAASTAAAALGLWLGSLP